MAKWCSSNITHCCNWHKHDCDVVICTTTLSCVILHNYASEDAVVPITCLEHWCHENRTAHEDKDHESGDPLLSDSQELGLLSWSGAARLHLQAVNVGDGEDSRSHEPWQTHDGTHTQHDWHYQQVQMIATAFLYDTWVDDRQWESLRACFIHNKGWHKGSKGLWYINMLQRSRKVRRAKCVYMETEK